MNRTAGAFVAAVVAVFVTVAASACAGGDAGSAADGTSTTVDRAASEAYERAGLDPRESRCIADSGVDGELTVTPGATHADPIVVESETGRVEIPATLRTNVELERLMLSAFASACAPASTLDRLAAIEGTAADEAAIAEILPAHLEGRRAAGATAAELACLDGGFRAAPARLASVAAAPAIVELACVTPERRVEWWRGAVDAALQAAGARPDERACLALSASDRMALASVLGDGWLDGSDATDRSPIDGGGVAVPAGVECADPERLGVLAVELAADGVTPDLLTDG